MGRGRNTSIPTSVLPHLGIIDSEKGHFQNDILTILLDEGYMQILREKIRLIQDKKKELNIA